MTLGYRRFFLSQRQWEILLAQLMEKAARLIKLTLQGTAGRPGTSGCPLGPNSSLQLTDSLLKAHLHQRPSENWILPTTQVSWEGDSFPGESPDENESQVIPSLPPET